MVKRSVIPLILSLCIIFNSSASFAVLVVPGGESYRVSLSHAQTRGLRFKAKGAGVLFK